MEALKRRRRTTTMEEKVEEEEGEEGVRDVERQGAPVERIPMFLGFFGLLVES